MTEVDQMDVLCYIYAKKEVSASDLKKQFVEDKDAVIEILYKFHHVPPVC